jgi:hypothetical protein
VYIVNPFWSDIMKLKNLTVKDQANLDVDARRDEIENFVGPDLIKVYAKRDPSIQYNLMKCIGQAIYLQGFTLMGPICSARKNIEKMLEHGKRYKLLLVDPTCDWLKEYIDEPATFQSQWLTSLLTLARIASNVKLEGDPGIEVRLFDTKVNDRFILVDDWAILTTHVEDIETYRSRGLEFQLCIRGNEESDRQIDYARDEFRKRWEKCKDRTICLSMLIPSVKKDIATIVSRIAKQD